MKQVVTIAIATIVAIGTVSAQSAESPKAFSLVARVASGDELGRFGLAGSYAFDGAVLASSMLWISPDEVLIFDSVNERLVVVDSKWNFSKTIALGNAGPSVFSLSGAGVVELYGQHGPRWIDLNTKRVKVLADPLEAKIANGKWVSFLFQYQDVLIFQNQAGGYGNPPASFFGIRGLATTKDVKQEYLDDAAVRKLLADPKNTRYQVTGNVILDRGQVASSDGESIQKYFVGRGTVYKQGDGWPSTDRNPALANGCYWVWSTSTQFLVRDERGGILRFERPVPNPDQNLYYSNMFPAPNGYIYQLRGDYKAGETRLYRIGPYPELKLDYHGNGGMINDNNVNLREEANIKAAVVMQLNKDTPVRILAQTDKQETIGGQKGVWYQVRLWDRTEGWVFGPFLDVGRMP